MLNEKCQASSKFHPKTSSVINQSCSEKLDIPQSIERKRRKLMFDHAKQINARSSDNESLKRKSALDGMWSTLINSASAHEMRSYMDKSPLLLTKVIPSIINEAVVKYEHSQKNLVRSLGVLYEGGILSKKQYNRKRSRETLV